MRIAVGIEAVLYDKAQLIAAIEHVEGLGHLRGHILPVGLHQFEAHLDYVRAALQVGTHAGRHPILGLSELGPVTLVPDDVEGTREGPAALCVFVDQDRCLRLIPWLEPRPHNTDKQRAADDDLEEDQDARDVHRSTLTPSSRSRPRDPRLRWPRTWPARQARLPLAEPP